MKLKFKEFNSPKDNIEIAYSVHKTAFGNCVIGNYGDSITNLHFYSNGDKEKVLSVINKYWHNASVVEGKSKSKNFIDQLFSKLSNDKVGSINLLVKGTKFQISVWRALLKIKNGKVVTYSDIAQSIEKPNALRAVGTAVGANPIAYLIPCHRVIKKNGETGNYRWGTDVKIKMLTQEGVL